MAFSPDGKRIVTGSFDETAQLWETATGKAIGEPLHHQDRVRSVAFSPDGFRVVTASFDNTARIWDVATGKPIGPPLHHKDWVVTTAFSRDGNRLITGSSDGTARLWQVPPPVPDEPRRIALWVQVITGMELDANGAIRVLDGAAWHRTRANLDNLGGRPF